MKLKVTVFATVTAVMISFPSAYAQKSSKTKAKVVSPVPKPVVKAKSKFDPFDCECNGRDKLLPTDAKYKRSCEKFEPLKKPSDCFGSVSKCADPTAPLETGNTQNDIQTLASSVPTKPDKNFKEILNYVSCFRSTTKYINEPNDQYCHFKKSLAPYIKLAAESSNLSPAVLACLFKQESQYDRYAQSGAPAYSYIQFTRPAMDTIGSILETPEEVHEKRWKAAEQEANTQLKEIEEFKEPFKEAFLKFENAEREVSLKQNEINILNRKITSLKRKKGETQELVATQKSLLDAKTEFKNLQSELKKLRKPIDGKLFTLSKLQAEYRSQLETVRGRRAIYEASKAWGNYWGREKTGDRSPNVPDQIDLVMAHCPKVAFAIAAAKLKYDLYSIVDASNIVEDEKGSRITSMAVEDSVLPEMAEEQKAYDTAIYITGAYNRGPGNYENLCDPADGVRSCMTQGKNGTVRRLPEETVAHMFVINNCAKAGSTKPMSTKESMQKDKDCAKYQCDI